MQKTPSSEQTWSAIVTPDKPLFNLPFREIWEYRDLILLSVHRDLVAIHRQTVMGPLWYFIQPLISTLVYQVIFGSIVGVPTDKIPPFLFFMSGIVIWYYFSTCFSRTSTVLTSNSGLFTKVYFPRLALPISQVLSSIWQFLIQFGIFLGFYLFFLWKGAPIEFSYRVVILPFLVLQTALLGLGCGCWVAAVTTRFRDLQMAVPPFLQMWMYASCILFPLSMASPAIQNILILNPMVPIVESFRFAMMGQGQVEIWQWLVSVVVTLLILVVGLISFNRAEKTMADTI
ncbi:MAG: ABC transporter permease [Chthoniobacterales bacterium]|nr:ABC transporter permease [Chthoniobacterales bacterium]